MVVVLIFIGITVAYELCLYMLQGIPQGKNLKLKFTHYELICSICLTWINENIHCLDRYGNEHEQYASPVPRTQRRRRYNVHYAPRVNYVILLPDGALKKRLISELCHMA